MRPAASPAKANALVAVPVFHGFEDVVYDKLVVRRHMAVKNHPFEVALNCPSVDLSRDLPRATLYVAEPKGEKLVSGAEQGKDLKVVIIPSKDKHKAQVKITILQLSSKFGDADFKIKLEAVSGSDGKPIAGIEQWISPIRVVSKWEQLANPSHVAAPDNKVQRVRGQYVQQLQQVRDMAADQLDAISALVRAKEDELVRTGRAHLLIAPDRDFLPETYTLPDAEDAKGEKAATRKPRAPAKSQRSARGKSVTKRRRNNDDGDDDDDDDGGGGGGGAVGGADDDDDDDFEEGNAVTASSRRHRKSAKTQAPPPPPPGAAAQPRAQRANDLVDPFDGAFFPLMAAFHDMGARRREVLEPFMRLTEKEREHLLAIVDAAAGGVAAALGGKLCTCVDCPHKRELNGLH